jgi:hypothetical protein
MSVPHGATPVQPPTGCITVDGAKTSTALNPFLSDVRNAFGWPTHDSIVTAISTLSNCESKGTCDAHIIGHGFPGAVMAGTGEIWDRPDKKTYLALDNVEVWEDCLRSLSVNSLTLWACNVGACDKGLKLLRRVAAALRKPVHAPTGYLFFLRGKFYLEPGAKWQTVDPNIGVDVALAADPPTPLKSRDSVLVRFNFPGEGHIDLSELQSARLSNASGKPVDLPDSLDDRGLVELVSFDKPQTFDARFSAILTGRLAIDYRSGDSTRRRDFRIYNDSILQDETSPRTFYAADQGLASLLKRP